MPRNPVIENVCDRCTRSWYTPADEKPLDLMVKINYAATDEQPLIADLKCLCDGCKKTVRGLIESITKVMTKSAPVRGAKKAAGEGKTPPATSTTPATAQAPHAAASGATDTADPAGVARPTKPPAAAGAPNSNHPSARPAPNPTRG